jgi:hypothetical protein
VENGTYHIYTVHMDTKLEADVLIRSTVSDEDLTYMYCYSKEELVRYLEALRRW